MHCTGAEPSLEVITDQQSALQHSFSDTKIALTLTVLPGQPSDCPQSGKTVKLVPSSPISGLFLPQVQFYYFQS